MSMRTVLAAAVTATAVVAPFSPLVAPALAAPGGGLTARLSLGAAAAEPDGISGTPSVADSGDVAFATQATNLGATDDNDDSDVWVRTAGGLNVLVSAASGGATAAAGSDSPAISANGRYVAFRSDANDLGVADGNNASDVYLVDRDPSADGLDGADRTVTRMSTRNGGAQANGDADQPALAVAPDGSVYVAFRSAATNVVTHDRNRVADVFVRELGTTLVTRMSTPNDGSEANGPSGNPSVGATNAQVFVAFESLADNLSFPDDPNGATDVYLRTLLGTPTTELVSVDNNEQPGNAASYQPSITADGALVAFASDATNLAVPDTNGWTDVLLRDRGTERTTMLASGNSRSDQPAISADGRAVAFRSFASNLGASDTNQLRDVYLRDLVNNTVVRSSVSSTGVQANGRSESPALSAKGEYVAFQSTASNLATDANGIADVFSRRRDAKAPTMTSLSSALQPSTWTANATIPITFAATENGPGLVSGLDGFGVVWDTSPNTVPTSKTHEETATGDSRTRTHGNGHWVHVRAVDNEGNWGNTLHRGPFWVDTQKPNVIVKVNGSDIRATALASSIPVSWSATDVGSGLDTTGFKIYFERIAYNSTGGFEPRVLWKTTTSTSASFPGSAGRTYRFTVERSDKAGNLRSSSDSLYGRPRADFPVDDTSATQVTDAMWTTVSSSAYYGGESQRSSTKGAALRLAVREVRQIDIVASHCSTCGSVQLFIAGEAADDPVSLAGSGNKHIHTMSGWYISGLTATIEIRVVSTGKPVYIEGIVAPR